MIKPLLLDNGGEIANGASPNFLKGTEKTLRPVVAGFTWSVLLIDPEAKPFQLACVAVIVEVPAPTMVTMSPTIVATDKFELV